MNCDSGFYTSNGNVVTFEVQGAISRDGMANSEYHNLYARYLNENRTMQLQGFTVPIWGEGHNLYPQEVYNTVSDNKLLPEILQKQVEFLFGRGPYLYTTITEGEGKNSRFGFRSKMKRSCLGLNHGRLTGTGISGTT